MKQSPRNAYLALRADQTRTFLQTRLSEDASLYVSKVNLAQIYFYTKENLGQDLVVDVQYTYGKMRWLEPTHINFRFVSN